MAKMEIEEQKYCVICGNGLTGLKEKYCSLECLKVSKREKMKTLRGNHKHIYICKICDKKLALGRKQITDTLLKCNLTPSQKFVNKANEESKVII